MASPSPVTETPPAAAQAALDHFSSLLSFETDCWDVHAALQDGSADFVLVDVRGPMGFEAGHVDGAINIAHPDLTAENLARFGDDTVFVVYCAGPHCNGADKAGVRLSRLGRPVKKMIGGVEGWRDEGFDLVR